MNNSLINLKEYEQISEINDKKYKVNKYFFADLERLLEDYAFDKKNQDIFDCIVLKRKKNLGKTLVCKNYIGTIVLKHGAIIQILPKIDFAGNLSQEDEYKLTKKVVIKMLQKTDSRFPKHFGNSNLSKDKITIFEILISEYIEMINRLIKNGLKNNYIIVENNLKFLKGKIDIKNNIQKNSFHLERLYCKYNFFSNNIWENKVVKTTLLFLLNLTRNVSNKENIKRLLLYFDDVKEITNLSDFDKIVINKSNYSYRQIIECSSMFLRGISLSCFIGKNKSFSLLFPMDKLFEKYIALCVKKIFSDKWDVFIQNCDKFLFNDVTNENVKKKFAIRPDIVLKNKQNDKILIMDTKWKRLSSLQNNYGISQSDMYQMYAYSKKFSSNSNSPEVYLIFPKSSEISSKTIVFNSDDEKNNVVVKAYFIEMSNIEQSLKKLHNEINSQI